MPTWKLRSPDSFPGYFIDAVQHGKYMLTMKDEARVFLRTSVTKEEAKVEADRFRHFRFCLRHHPLHRLHSAERDLSLKLSCRQHKRAEGMFTLSLILRHKRSTDDLSLLLAKASN